jgi:uncharacterized CHY-type Zn-finger protein
VEVVIHDTTVFGVAVDQETRCAHYGSECDIIAIKFKCCGEWYPCHSCHAELAGHAPERWPAADFDTHAVLCGACGNQLSVREYLACSSVCPRCGRDFNPGCANHHGLYFEQRQSWPRQHV